MFKVKHQEKKKLLSEALIASFVVAFVFAAILPKVFAVTAYYLANANVELDGTNGGSVTLSLNTPVADQIFSIEGNFQTTDGSGNFTLTALTPAASISPSSNVVSDGRILWQDTSWENPLVLGERESMWTATYAVASSTPAGDYSVCLTGTRISSESNDYSTPNYGNICATVTVTRNDAPAVKPSQVVTFRNSANETITEITKYYGDDDFIITKEVTTGNGTIGEYHPDDDGSGSVAHTVLGEDTVGVGVPGDVEICAWVAETDDYAATKACYTVHVLKRPLDITGATIQDKSYDGTVTATVTNVTFEDRALNAEDYTATASFDDADAGENKVVHVSVELTGDAANNYVLNAQNHNTTKTITPYVLRQSEVTLASGNTYAYDPSGVEPGVVVTANTHGGTSTLGSDNYEVVYSDNTRVGTGHASVTGKGNFTTGDNPIVLDFTIEPRGINLGNLVAPSTIVENHILTASEININVDGVNLTRCTTVGDTTCDYTLEISGDNDGQVGHFVHVAAEGVNNYTGVAVRDIEIVAKLPQTVTIGDVTGTTVVKYYGDASFANVATTDGDGTISYSSSDESIATVDGNGNVTIHEVGGTTITATAQATDTYASASASYYLSVERKTISVGDVTVADKTYDGKTSAIVSSASLSEGSLTLGSDFTANAVFSNANVGEQVATVTITLNDDAFNHYVFSGNAKTVDVIKSGNISQFGLTSTNATAVLNPTNYDYDGDAKEPAATVTVDLDGDGTKEVELNVGSDYTLSYDANVNAGTANVTVSGTGNYTGSIAGLEFTINPATVSNVTVSAATQTYTGSALEPVVTVTGTVNGSEVTFTADDFAVAGHDDFVNAGDYSFTVNAKEGSNYNIPATNGMFTIAKAESGEPTNTPSDLTAEVGQTLADAGDLPEGFTWVDDTTVITAGMNEYEATYTKNGDTTNYNTVSLTIPVLGYSGEYEVIKGAGQEYVIGESEAALFEIDADYELFDGGEVYIDNALVEPANYESWSNSTVIQFKKEYMDGLAVGQHTLAVLFNDGGMAKATFTVKNPVSDDEEPGTADTGVFTGVAGGAMMTGLTAVTVSVLIGVFYVTKRKNS